MRHPHGLASQTSALRDIWGSHGLDMSHSIFRQLVMREVWHVEHVIKSEWDHYDWLLMLFKISDTWWDFFLSFFFYILGPQLRREDNVGPSKPHAFSIRSINESLADYEKHAHSKGFYKTPWTWWLVLHCYLAFPLYVLCSVWQHITVVFTFLKYLQLAKRTFISNQNNMFHAREYLQLPFFSIATFKVRQS